MIALTQKETEAQLDRNQSYRQVAYYRRRYWDWRTGRFVLEPSFTQIPRSWLKGVGQTRDQLDRAGVNEFKTSNITLELDNRRNRWSARNSSGVFAADDTARHGYEPQLMEFKLVVYQELADGTESNPLVLFIGRASSWDAYPQAKTASVIVEGKTVLLRRPEQSAETVSNYVANKLLTGVVDGVNRVFTTANLGVARIVELRKAGTALKQGVDYTISQLGEHDKPAEITMVVPPTVITGGPRADYYYWLRDQKPEDLVVLLLQAAGLTPAEYNVSPVAYPTGVQNTRTFTTKIDWLSGTLENFEAESYDGDIIRRWFLLDNFDDGDLAGWTFGYYGSGSVSVVSGRIQVAANASAYGSSISAFRPINFTTGTVYFKAQTVNSISGLAPNWLGQFWFLSTSNSSYAYCLDYNPDVNAVRFRKRVGIQMYTIATLISGLPSGEHTWRITRDQDGLFSFYFDGSFLTSVTDLTFSEFKQFYLLAEATGDDSQVVYCDDIYFSRVIDTTTTPTPDDPQWTSPVIDGTATLGSHTRVECAVQEFISATASIETRTSSSAVGPWSSWLAVGPNGVVMSPQLRYLQFRLTLVSSPIPPDFVDARISEAVNFFTTSTAYIRMADFGGMGVYDAIKALGEIANYEWGFDRLGVFFFRPRAFDPTPRYTITIKNDEEITRVSDGVDRVFNEIRAQYGSSERVLNPPLAGDGAPTSFQRYGVKRLNIGSSGLLVDPDADVATGLARSYYQQFKDARRHVELSIPFAPHLELADTILLNVLDSVEMRNWFVGDSSVHIGQTDIALWSGAQQSAYGMVARVLSVAHDAVRRKTKLELEEIPTNG